MLTAGKIQLSKAVGLDRNPKDHDIGSINTSLSRFGYLERVVINSLTGHILSGHGRIETLRKMKVRGSAPPINIEVDDGEWFVPCDYVELPAEEEEAAAIALNRLVEVGGWNNDMLTKVLSDLAAVGVEKLDGIGFDTDDLDALLKDDKDISRGSDEYNDEDKNSEDDFAEKMQAKWGVSDGDIYKIGEHVVGCGSCRDLAFVQKMLAGQSVNLIMTSPPYAKQRKSDYGGIEENEYTEWWEAVSDTAKAILAENGSFFVNIKPNVKDGQRSLYVWDMVSAMVRQCGWMLIDEFCWSRLGNPGDWPNRFKNGFEPVYHFSKIRDVKFRPDEVGTGVSGSSRGGGNKSTGNYYNMSDKTVEWQSARPSNLLPSFGNASGWGHAAAFPVGLPEFFILAFSDPGDLVFDPFGGSGTTAVAAHINGRKSVTAEKLPEYTAIILERLSDATGEEPIKIQE